MKVNTSFQFITSVNFVLSLKKNIWNEILFFFYLDELILLFNIKLGNFFFFGFRFDRITYWGNYLIFFFHNKNIKYFLIVYQTKIGQRWNHSRWERARFKIYLLHKKKWFVIDRVLDVSNPWFWTQSPRSWSKTWVYGFNCKKISKPELIFPPHYTPVFESEYTVKQVSNRFVDLTDFDHRIPTDREILTVKYFFQASGSVIISIIVISYELYDQQKIRKQDVSELLLVILSLVSSLYRIRQIHKNTKEKSRYHYNFLLIPNESMRNLNHQKKEIRFTFEK